jgi:triphosphoribosyl-dephospho-CoA synthase
MTDASSHDRHDGPPAETWARAVGDGLARLTTAVPPGSRGWPVGAACILEASAPKPGNVHPGAAFPDLAYADLVAAAVAIAPVFERAAEMPLGGTILAAVAASAAVTRSNANLGIVLAIAPLAAAAAATPEGVVAVLARLGPADAADVWRAIALARPGGLGASDRHDLGGPPPHDLLEAMRAAADRDQIARLWATGYEDLFRGPVTDLLDELAAGRPLDDAIVRAHLRHLARESDTLIARRHGGAAAVEVSRRAAAVLDAGPEWRAAAAEFDRSLRSPQRVNPGTTADLVAAALYILVRERRIPLL